MEQKKTPTPSGMAEALRAFGLLSGVGIYVLVFLGKCADDFFGTGRTCTIAGIVLGFPAAIYSLYRQLKYYKLV